MHYGPSRVGTPQLIYHTDQQGSVRAITNGSAQLVYSTRYEPYGHPRHTANGAGYSEQPLAYTGAPFDPEGAVIYLNARYYAPGEARFIQRDSVFGSDTDPVSLNRYVYARDNPMMYNDPSGHDACGGDIPCSPSLNWGCGPYYPWCLIQQISGAYGAALGVTLPDEGPLFGAEPVFRNVPFALHPNLEWRLNDPRMQGLQGRLTADDINGLLNNPNAVRFMNRANLAISVVQDAPGMTHPLRITVSDTRMEVISLGPIDWSRVRNRIAAGDYILLPFSALPPPR